MSSPGKHGAAKARIKCSGLFTKKKKQFLGKAKDRVQIPDINKGIGQLSEMRPDAIVLMDLETYETIECGMLTDIDDEMLFAKSQALLSHPEEWANYNVEYWSVVGKYVVTRFIEVE